MGQWMYYIPVSPAEFQQVAQDPSEAVSILLYNDEIHGRQFTTEKTWNALDYLIAEGPLGQDPVLATVIEGGTEIPGTDFDAPLRYFTPDEVKKLASSLLKATSDQLLTAYDPARMNELHVYPLHWGEDRDFDKRYLTDWFDALVHGFSRAASAGQYVLVYLSV